MRIFFFAIGAIVLLLVGRVLTVLIPATGALSDMTPVGLAGCTRIDIAPGTEDLQIDHTNGLVYISASERRTWYLGDKSAGPDARNGIYVFPLSDPSAVRKISTGPENFMAHGISLWRGEDGAVRLFVVNHPTTGEEIVEIFDAAAVADGGDLTHLRSVSFDAMTSPNDVVAVGPEQFYVSNDIVHDGGLLQIIEIYLAASWSSVAYFDGENGRLVAKGLAYANGINVSPDGDTIYVAEILNRRINAYARDAATGDLRRTHRFPVPTAPDNIDIDIDGRIWTAGHPNLLAFEAHAKDASNIAPSQVVRIDPGTGATTTPFMSVDGEINGSAGVAVHDGRMVIGAVFDGHVLNCPAPAP